MSVRLYVQLPVPPCPPHQQPALGPTHRRGCTGWHERRRGQASEGGKCVLVLVCVLVRVLMRVLVEFGPQ